MTTKIVTKSVSKENNYNVQNDEVTAVHGQYRRLGKDRL